MISARKMATASKHEIDFNAVLLDQESIKQLNMLLFPNHPLSKDVRLVAGSLGFKVEEITYITTKPYPFVYMYDQWLKRDKQSAKLSKLLHVLNEMRRFDAAEQVEKAIQTLHEQDPKDILRVEERYFSTLQRSISCTTLYLPETYSLSYEQETNSTKETLVPSLLQQRLAVEVAGSKAPDVFVVYYPENEDHVKNVSNFVNQSRRCNIDASADMYGSESLVDRGFYIYSKLVEAEFVFVVCSERLYEYSKMKTNEDTDRDGSAKDVSFVMKLILKEIYESAGNNTKFIPVLLPRGNEAHVPMILKSSTIYKMPVDFDDLKGRVFGIERYRLAPLPTKRPKMKPRIIGR